MRKGFTGRMIGQGALLAGLLLAPLAASAKPATINDITLDVPAGFTVESAKRGILAKTPDGEVDVWVETYKADESDALIAEHEKYWTKNKVDGNGDGTTTDSTEGDLAIHTIDYKNATWKGDPTVLRYVQIGPIGTKKEMVLVTYWASPGGDKQYNAAIKTMIGTMDVKLAQ